MLLIRPLDFADLQALERLAILSGGSMTTLPANRDHLNELIARTRRSLAKTVIEPGDESYHFALIDTATDTLAGVCGIDASVGLNTPFYSYRLDEIVHASGDLQIHNRIPALHLCQDYTGAARFCTLFLDHSYRNTNNLHLLSRTRMLFIAQHRERFANRLIAELQGQTDNQNQSPFWECLGRHFFNMDFHRANYLTGINVKGFIADLMPHYPVYVPLLTPAAQAALGKARPDLAAVEKLLHKEGLSYQGYVDIFDAGPTLEARTSDLASIKNSSLCTPEVSTNAEPEGPCVLISNLHSTHFRSALTRLDPQAPVISAELANALHLQQGDQARFVPL